jgi:hypothetical protein
MPNNQKSELSKSIYINLQSMNNDELLAIWDKNDRLEWTDETFLLIHEILIERLGSVPDQNTFNPKRKRKKIASEKGKTFINLQIMWLSAIPTLVLTLLIPIIKPSSSDLWFPKIYLISITIFALVPGLKIGWESWVNGNQYQQRIRDNLPLTKKAFGGFYGFVTYFLPDRFVPVLYLFLGRLMSFVLIIGGISILIFAVIIK